MASLNRQGNVQQSTQQQQQKQQIPQSLKLTDYLRPCFQESHMIREYCQFTQIQSQNQVDSSSSLSASMEALNNSSSSGGGQPRILTGVYVIPSAQSQYLWFGLLCVNNDRSQVPSPWHGGVFRFFIRFPENYPNGYPSIFFLPTTSSSSQQGNPHHPLNNPPQQPQSPQNYSTLSSHPDINQSTGQFNLRAYVTSSSAVSYSHHVPRIYKVLRLVRKSFYRHFTDVEVQSSVNPGAAEMCARDYQEFLRNCAIDAAESLKYFRDVDKFVVQKFKGDQHLILLAAGDSVDTQDDHDHGRGGGSSSNGEVISRTGGGGGNKRGSELSNKRVLGLSFM